MWWFSQAMAQSFMPVQASQFADDVDRLYGFLLVASLISCILLIGGMIYFAIRYKRKTKDDQTAYITHNSFLEFLWSFIPFVIFMFVFGWGWKIYHDMKTPPEDAFEVHVFGKQWLWEFEYKSGRKTVNELWVPLNKPIKLIMTSEDVLHSFFVPSFRVKQDVVPGMYTMLWFTANKVGDFQVFCTEYCGAAHSNMLAKIKVRPAEEFEKWLANDPNKGKSLAEIGEGLYKSKGCVACHSTDGLVMTGPTFKGMFSRKSELTDGSSVTVDENYIRSSILDPNSKIVKGFPKGVMPTFQGQVNEQELSAIIAFLKKQ